MISEKHLKNDKIYLCKMCMIIWSKREVFISYCVCDFLFMVLLHEERKHDVIKPGNMKFDVGLRSTPI